MTPHAHDRSPSRFRLRLLAATLFLALGAGLSGIASAAQDGGDGRLVILGFDGADGRTALDLMEKGELPHLSALRETGTFAPLGTTMPAESPVAWATLNSGQNPAKTGIAGFVRRRFLSGNPSPWFGHLEMDQKVPVEDYAINPILTWSPLKLGGLIGGGAFLLFALVFAGLLRMRMVIALPLALLLGGAGFYGGMVARGYLPDEMVKLGNPLKAAPFWEYAAEGGVESIVLDAAQCFDRAPVAGTKVLAGLGVPDARGGIQSFFLYTTDPEYTHRPGSSKTGTNSGGNKFRVDETEGRVVSEVFGPKNLYEIERLQREIDTLDAQRRSGGVSPREAMAMRDRVDELKEQLSKEERDDVTVPLVVEKLGETAKVTLGEETQELREGEWSDWYHLSFELNPLLAVKAITRAKILSMDGPFELYVNALEIDPASPPFWQPISQPHTFASELEEAVGPFETIGWACMTMPFKDDLVDPVSFMQDIEFTMKWRERLTYSCLERDDWSILMSCLSTPDRVQHMMYQFYDEGHPLYDPAAADQTMTFFGETITLRDAIPAIYRQVDRIVGKVVDEHLGEGDTLMICADHGFQSFRRGVNINNWLYEKGYLAVRENLQKKHAGTLGFVDWDQTRAYSLGLGNIYLNLAETHARGIVQPEEVDALLASIAADFLAEVDSETGENVGAAAEVMREIHEGPFLDLEAEMSLGFGRNYRVSWRTTLGGMKLVEDEDGKIVPGPIVEDNTKAWSGDHVSVAPRLVEGMFFSNRKVEVPAGGVDIRHLAPTALSVFGLEPPPEYDLPALRFVD